MSQFVAALPMYDWPEARAEVDADWSRIFRQLSEAGLWSPSRLTRRNGDLPPVMNGIRDEAGALLAPDPSILPTASFDLATLWLHPSLLFAQTCWGPLEQGLSNHVTVVGQPDYSSFEGGSGELYTSVVLARDGDNVPAPDDGRAQLPLDMLRGKRLAYNGTDSMSGWIALSRDLEALGASLDLFSSARTQTGSHRASLHAVASGVADVCAIDCRTWDLARRFEPAAREVRPIGWTSRRKGLPYIAANRLAPLYRGLRLEA